jgi:hypothetical protein
LIAALGRLVARVENAQAAALFSELRRSPAPQAGSKLSQESAWTRTPF